MAKLGAAERLHRRFATGARARVRGLPRVAAGGLGMRGQFAALPDHRAHTLPMSSQRAAW